MSLAEKNEKMAIAEDNEQLTLEEKEEKWVGPLVDLGGQIIVNLRGMDGRNHLLRTSLSIEVDSEETRREVESKIIMIRYSLTRLLSSRRPEEVIGAEQMELVRNSMKQTADAVLASKKAKLLTYGPTIGFWSRLQLCLSRIYQEKILIRSCQRSMKERLVPPKQRRCLVIQVVIQSNQI